MTKIRKAREDLVREMGAQYLGKKKRVIKDFEKSTSKIDKDTLVPTKVFDSLASRGELRTMAHETGHLDFVEGETRIRDILNHYRFPKKRRI